MCQSHTPGHQEIATRGEFLLVTFLYGERKVTGTDSLSVEESSEGRFVYSEKKELAFVGFEGGFGGALLANLFAWAHALTF